ncbi:MAG: dihydroorotate dehydrogenase [Planctomycetota bacterium]|nr:MAG: dihydroorotate dehydrogenase [Planctomycetota bacterium]
MPAEVDLGVRLGALALANPVMTASGTFGYAAEMERFFSPAILGAIVGKSVTLEPREGNPPPRMAETPAGMLNSIGLQNPGAERFLATHLPRLRAYGVPVVVNIAGKSVAEFERLAELFDGQPGVAALELNLSCPNVRQGGLEFSAEPRACEEVCSRVRRRTRLPVFAKLTPNTADVPAVARAAEAAGADAVTAINTYLGLAVRWRERRAVLATDTGGLSGPAIKPLALRIVAEVARAVSIPVIAAGGIGSAEDVLEFMVAGASAVQVGTATFFDPHTIPRILAELPRLLAEEGISRVADVIGTLRW